MRCTSVITTISCFFSCCLLSLFTQQAVAQVNADIAIINARILDSRTGLLSARNAVFITGNKITGIGENEVAAAAKKVIDAKGQTLMPGLIDVHVHLVFGSLSIPDLLKPELAVEQAFKMAADGAEQMLLRGFTSVRDVGGPIFPLKAGIDAGKWKGPRIWPSGAVVSQTAGHGDFRLPDEPSRRFTGQRSRAEQVGATFIADGRDEVLTAVRENLRFGASQIKVMAGGGTSSAYDPVDVTQYTLDEMKAAVEAAADWGTYVTVHAYTPKAVRRAIEAGVKCIEHGQLLDEPTLQLMAQKKVWLSMQNLIADSPKMDSLRRQKRKPVIEGQSKIWPLAKKYGVPLAWGTDFLFEPELNKLQNPYILKLQQWFTNAEIIKMVTYDNAQLLQLSGNRSPYPGKLGVIEKGAYADLILVNGNPLTHLELLADPDKHFTIIMKDGVVVKNTLQ